MAPGFNGRMTDQEIKSELRNLKLRIINNEFKFSISRSIISKLDNELSFIKEKFKNDIISGSLALKMYGFLKRDINDIDIIIDNKNRYTDYSIGHRYQEEDQIINRLGYKNFNYKRNLFSKNKKYQVDFFENNNTPYDIVNINGVDLKIHNPMEILSLKAEMSGSKHRDDLSEIFNHLNMLDFASEYMKDYHNMLDNI